jgi:hypothetical protein
MGRSGKREADRQNLGRRSLRVRERGQGQGQGSRESEARTALGPGSRILAFHGHGGSPPRSRRAVMMLQAGPHLVL